MSGGKDSTLPSRSKLSHAPKNLPAKAPLHSWAWPTAPWERVHVDYAGPFLGKVIFIAVDSSLKIAGMTITTAAKIIAALREMFARYGIP